MGLPDPRPDVVERTAREIGLFLPHLEPAPGPSELLIVYATILIRLCKDYGVDRELLFQYVQDNYEGYHMSDEERRRTGN